MTNLDSTRHHISDVPDNQAPTTRETPLDDRDAWVKKVKTAYSKVSKNELPSELKELVFELPSSRLNSHTNRSYFVKSVARFIFSEQQNTDQWDQIEPDVVKLALCAEMMITVQYYHNYIFDSKNGVNTPLLIRETLIKGNLLKSWLFRYIEHAGFPHDFEKLVRNNIDKAFDQTDIGQFIEGRYNSFEHYRRKELKNDILDYYMFQNRDIDWHIIDDCVSISCETLRLSNFEHLFLKLYYLRLYLISTALYQTFTNILIESLHPDEALSANLRRFSAYYGIMMQVVNDTADFVPGYYGQDTKPKFPQDQQCDIRNKNITLPLFIYLHHEQGNTHSNIIKLLQSDKTPNYSERRESLIFKEIRPVLIQYTIPIGKAIADRAIRHVKRHSALAELLSIAFGNRFYKEIDHG